MKNPVQLITHVDRPCDGGLPELHSQLLHEAPIPRTDSGSLVAPPLDCLIKEET
jgi:hypothetical protein